MNIFIEIILKYMTLVFRYKQVNYSLAKQYVNLTLSCLPDIELLNEYMDENTRILLYSSSNGNTYIVKYEFYGNLVDVYITK